MKKISYGLRDARRDLPRRLSRDNKTIGGKAVIAAGSRAMPGAAFLAATAAARIGAGYVYLASQNNLDLRGYPDFLKWTPALKNPSAVAVGPGLSKSSFVRGWLVRAQKFPCVLDAEALNVLAKTNKKVSPQTVLTPHEGELSRLLGVSADKIRAQREASVVNAQKKWGGVMVLKGHRTLVCDGRTLWTVTAGNAALAKAGTGDVLTGMIVGLLSQGLQPAVAACLGVYLHGRIAEEWIASRKDVLSLMPSDLLVNVAVVAAKVRRSRS